MDVLSGTYILPIVKMDISKYTQTFIKDYHNNVQVMIGKVPLKTSQIYIDIRMPYGCECVFAHVCPIIYFIY